MTAVPTTKATRLPSGETRTDVTRLTLKASSGVHAETGPSACPRGTGDSAISSASVPAIRMPRPPRKTRGLYESAKIQLDSDEEGLAKRPSETTPLTNGRPW